jgi:hypothetical protein
MSAFEKIPTKIPLAKIVKIADCNFNCNLFAPIQTQDEEIDLSDLSDLCTAMPTDGRCAPHAPSAYRAYTPVTPLWRPDSPFWPGQYDGGVYICHICECTHANGICPGALMAPTPTYDLSDDEEHVQDVVAALMGEPKDHCCGTIQCPYVPGRPDAKRKAHFEGMYLTRKKRACVDAV